MKMRYEKLYKFLLFLGITLGVLTCVLLYCVNISLIIKTLNEIEGLWAAILIILIRISLLSVMTFYVFNKWFKQENLYLSDIPHLFGLFLLLLIFGKLVDLFWNLTYFRFDEEFVLVLLKIRYFIIILEFIPLMYLSIVMLFYSLSLRERFIKLRDRKYADKLTIRLLIIIALIEMFAVIMAPNVFILGRILPFILIPSLIVIIYIFFFAYKHKRLSEVHPLIIAFGFLLYTISSILRPLIQAMLGESMHALVMYIIIAEIIDLFVFIVIFIGLYLKASYTET